MICPLCRTIGAEVSQTMDVGATINRRRRCRCGCRWTTEERVLKSTISIPPVVPPQGGNSPPVSTGIPPAFARGVGGVLSSDLDSDPISPSVPEASGSGARARKSAAVVYSPHFTVFWDNIGSTRDKGSKAQAQEEWDKKGRPSADGLIAKWNEYLGSRGELSPKDVCRWLKHDMHLQEYNAPIRPVITPRDITKGWGEPSDHTKHPRGEVKL